MYETKSLWRTGNIKFEIKPQQHQPNPFTSNMSSGLSTWALNNNTDSTVPKYQPSPDPSVPSTCMEPTEPSTSHLATQQVTKPRGASSGNEAQKSEFVSIGLSEHSSFTTLPGGLRTSRVSERSATCRDILRSKVFIFTLALCTVMVTSIVAVSVSVPSLIQTHLTE